MGKRGRKPRHPAINALCGDPNMRRTQLAEPLSVEVPLGLNQIDVRGEAAIPSFLDRPGEQAAFRLIVEDYLQRRIARAADLPAYGRWAVYAEMWIEVKRKVIETGAHLDEGTRSPLVVTLKHLDEMLGRLDDRLGLNPMARQEIIRTLSSMPAPTHLEGEAPKPKRGPGRPRKVAAPSEPERPASPLGFLSVVK
jgi:phage terminase small subunit